MHATGVTQTGLKLSFSFHSSYGYSKFLIANCKQFNFAFSGTVVNHVEESDITIVYTLIMSLSTLKVQLAIKNNLSSSACILY